MNASREWRGSPSGQAASVTGGCSRCPALWIATAGGVVGFLSLLPSPLPGFRMPSARPAAEAAGRAEEAVP